MMIPTQNLSKRELVLALSAALILMMAVVVGVFGLMPDDTTKAATSESGAASQFELKGH